MANTEELIAGLSGNPHETNPKIVAQRSRDFYWYSPVLKRQREGVTGDIVVSPRSEDEVIAVLAVCFRLDIPVTPRGGGTGNYGQAMPLAGGVVLDLRNMNRIIDIRPGCVSVEAGAARHARGHHGLGPHG
ncbi:MAG: FAD-binding oxidoreductase [Aestuariivirga sp.]|uniref:FAD-binding oxidoreductase n=1 Tax=Aestuariivirga sp. TaxID=2650926 RepID=UPI0038D0CF5C